MKRVGFLMLFIGIILLSPFQRTAASCDLYLDTLSQSEEELVTSVEYPEEDELIEYDRKKYFELIESFKSKNISQSGVFQILQEPIELDYLFEIYAVSYPRGRAGGELWHIRPRSEWANRIAKIDGKKYIKLETEFNSKTKGFYDFFYRTLKRDPLLGDYWATRESPKLFGTLRYEWHRKVGWWRLGSARINMKFVTTGADSQIKMADLRVGGMIGLANPKDKVLYIATGQPVPDLKNPDLKVSAHTGRVTQKSSLALHDLQEMDSAVWVTYEISKIMREVSWIWMRVYAELKHLKSGEIATHDGAIKISKIFLDHRKKNPKTEAKMEGFFEEGTSWSRLVEIEIYRSQRAFHGYGHLQSTLIQLPKGIGLQQDSVISKFGPVNQREFDMHRWSLGFKAGSPPTTFNPLLQLTYENGTLTDPLTLERAIESITNGEFERLRKFAEVCPNFYVRERIGDFLKKQPNFSKSQIAKMASDQRQHYKELGKGPRKNWLKRIKYIFGFLFPRN